LTSIAPGNLESQRLALQSWQVLGFKVISLNNSSEVTILRSLYPHTTFHAVSRDAELEVGKPLIYLDHVWEYLQNACVKTETGNGIFGIINSDIHLKVDFDDLALIEREAKQSLVVSSRIEVENPDQTTGRIYTRGFDAFFFDADLLAKLPKSNYCLGMPWWDFWLPLIAQQHSVPIKYLTTPAAYHVQHRINYRSDLWERFGMQFASLLQPDLARSLTASEQPGLPALRQQLIGVIDTFLQSFHRYAQRLNPMSVNPRLDSSQITNTEAAELHLETGDIYREQGKLAEAIASYQKALSHDPNYALAYLGLLKIYLLQGITELATETVTTIQALQPEILGAELYIQFGKVLVQKGKSIEAIGYLQQAINQLVNQGIEDNSLVESYLSLGDIYLNQVVDLESAIFNYRQAIAIQPQSSKAHWQLAQAFQQQSLTYQQAALDLEPHLADISAHFSMGLDFSAQGKMDWAVRAYQRAVRLKPDWAEAHCNLGNALSAVGSIDEAAKSLKKAIALNPNLIEAYSNLGNALVRQGDINAGISYHQKAIQLKPDWAELHYNLGDALANQNRLEETITAVTEAIRLKPTLAEAHRLLGNTLVMQSKFAAAIPYLQNAVNLKPDWSDAHHNLAKALVNNGQVKEAIAEFKISIAINPLWAQAHWDMGVAHWLIEQTPEAIACFQAVVDLDPTLADVHQGLSTMLRIGGNFPACRQAADRYAQTCETQDPVRVLVTLIKCYLESGLNQIAQQHFQQLESLLLQPNVTLQDREVRLIYEDLVFSLPYLRDRIDLNGHLNKLIGGAYTLLCLPPVNAAITPANTTKRRSKKSIAPKHLRIGIISKHLRRHSVGWCSRGIISEWSKITPNLHLYLTGRGGCDDLTAEFQQMTDHFFDFSKQSNLELLEKLRSDNLDILIDMDSVMHPGHALILHHSPAKLVFSWLGCEPPYISDKNYYLCDRHTHPESLQPHYTEQLIHMPDFTVAIADFPAKPVDRDLTRANLGISPETVAYLSVATGHKVNPELVRSHISILRQVPHSILLHKGFCDVEVVRSLYAQESQAQGIDPERFKFMMRQQLEEDHRLYYQIADIALDTYPYNGGTHNLESLWFDLPLVILCGEQATSRMGYTFLKAVGINEGVANSWDEYTDWGMKLGIDRDLRLELQHRLRQSKQPETLAPIWHPQKFAADAYAIFQTLLRAYPD
jgi:protein O-GlcNAc transferase